MNRRGFLTMLGGAAGAMAVRQWPFRVYSFASEPKVVSATIGEYADYISLNSLIDPIVAEAARELGYRAGLTVDQLFAAAYRIG